MPIAPDRPFPKMKGHVVRSKDWNDLVAEVQRLDAAKVNRVGDVVKGPLTVQDALTASPGVPAVGTRLHVLETGAPAVLRIQSGLGFGESRLEMWSDAPGSATEWRPSYIQSIDTGNYTGGLAFVTNGTGVTQRQGAVEAMRVVNGRVGIGVPNPGLRLEVAERIRIRQGAMGGGGLVLFQNNPNTDRAFVGMTNDNILSLSPGPGNGLGLHVDMNSGNVGVRTFPAGPPWSLYVNGDGLVTGRLRDAKIRAYREAADRIAISSISTGTVWNDIPAMSVGVYLPMPAWYSLRFNMNGVQALGVTQAQGEFRLLVDGGQVAYTLNEFHNDGWNARGVALERYLVLQQGSHTVSVQWSIRSPQAKAAVVGVNPEVRATLTGCFYGDLRTLSAFEY